MLLIYYFRQSSAPYLHKHVTHEPILNRRLTIVFDLLIRCALSCMMVYDKAMIDSFIAKPKLSAEAISS